MSAGPAVTRTRPSPASDGRRPAPVILLYHRIADTTTDPQCLCVSRKHFAEHLSVLEQHFHPISLTDLLGDLERGTARPRSVVVTFDDGYADNLHCALPCLEASGIAATVFVVSGYLNGRREFWWDELERITMQNASLPESLTLEVGKTRYEWRNVIPSEGQEVDPDRRGGWTVLDPADPTPRHRLYRELFVLFRPVEDEPRRDALADLRSWAGCINTVRPTHRPLTGAELALLADSGLIEVGGHTATHPVLAALSESRQAEEIENGKARIENVIGRSITCFSYPFGTRRDYTAASAAIARGAGFGSACSNFVGPIGAATDRFQLPRLLIRDWDGDTLLRHIEESFRAPGRIAERV